MAAPSENMSDLVPLSNIGDVVQSANWDPIVAESVAWIKDLPPGRGPKQTWPRWQRVPVTPGTKPELADFEAVDMFTEAAEVTVGYVGISVPISREVIHDAAVAIPRTAIEEAVRGVRDRIDSDVLAVISGTPHTEGADNDELDLDTWGEHLAAYKKLKPPGTRHAFIGHSDQIADLLADIRDKGATLLPANTQGMFGATTGLIGIFENIAIFETQNVPPAGDGWGGCFTPIGDRLSGLGLVVAERLGVEIDNAPRQKAVHAVVAARYGAIQTNPDRILRVVSRPAAA